MIKDYRAMSLAYQPCNRPIHGEKREKTAKKDRSKKKKSKDGRFGVLCGYAEKNRAKMTPSEKILDVALSEILPRHSLKHASQHVVKDCILDFAIPSHRLAIEVDGIYHFFRGRQDGFRTKKLKKRGWRVIRFTNHAVETDILGVTADILEACGSQFRIQPEAKLEQRRMA